ncbi:hypothetical protein AB0N61_12625 [Microbacterium sp. NPDC089320]|uniref:hypothetical protein n=1 Tax=Microbacterium sp. NPDC089320 TaxID=3155182 RepID=UPI0034224D18
MPTTAHTYFYTSVRADSVVQALQHVVTDLKHVEWRVFDSRSVAFGTRGSLFEAPADVRIVTTALAAGGSDVRIAVQSTTRRSTTRRTMTTRAADRLSLRIQKALG